MERLCPRIDLKGGKMDSRPLFLFRNSLLGRSISRHLHEFHCGKSGSAAAGESVSRRKFLTNTAGAAGLAFWIPGLAEAGQGNGKATGKSSDPRPIPGGVSPFGIFIHHFGALPTAAPLASLNDP